MPVEHVTENTELEDISIQDTIGAAYDAVESGEAAPDTPVLEIDATPETVDDAAPDTPSDESTAKSDDAAPDDTPTDADPDADPDHGAEPSPEDAAPSSWKREVAEKWKDLPPEARAEIHRRETDYHKSIETYKQNAAIGQDIQRVVTPYMANIQAAGVEPMAAIDRLLVVEHHLRNGTPAQKAQMVSEILRDYGIDLATVQPPAPVDPAVQALQQQNQQLQRFQQSIVEQQNQAVMSDIEKFRTDPANVHFEAVKDDMAALLQSGRAESLKDAYDKAVWMRPDIRKSLVEQQRTEAEKKAAQAGRQQRAKSAAVGVKGSAPSKVSTLGPDASLTDTVAAAMDGLI
ncbi:hypothetical protein RE432_18340 [Pusillimonas sp. SM2304]|uniref:hypothetical protein n=1 Tax=Pusillimonas sp. SM2304 TaxID=3073241 RepID=UPI002876ACBE|nr:hypothetical protein [Pusillimonas sp. SM2304]MDS1142397.1 hypothetical protein [Pusillimonas sp. SM2304]